MIKQFKHILLIDDDESLNKVIAFQLSDMGFSVATAIEGIQGIEQFKAGHFDVVITDLQLPDISGMEVLQRIRQLDPHVIIIIITAYGTVENAVEASKIGADDYITKPFGKETLRFTIEKAIKLRMLQMENIRLRGELYEKFDFSNIIGRSAAMEDVLKLTSRVAMSDATVLIQGESGTGKELIARAIHYNSPRKDKPFITVNCPSIPDTLIESELFGHVRGSYTGASKDRQGKFQMADKGTIFLDEIGDLGENLQAKLLRVLQEKEIERIGESKPIRVDTRVVAATNKNLEQRVQDGLFREDLYYRLNVVTITIPPLRERKDDIPFLVDHFMAKYSQGKPYRLTPDALELLQHYYWPGNVRELENTIERAVVISPSFDITPEQFTPSIQRGTAATPLPAGTDMTLSELERQAILDALAKANGNQTKAARLLDIPRHVLLYRMKKLGL